LSGARRKGPRKSPSRRINGAAVKPVAVTLDVVVASALDGMKAVNVRVIDVRRLSDIFDTLVIASGTSDRHVRSIADSVVEKAQVAGFRPLGIEGQKTGDWVLVDLGDVVVHVMLPRVREFYSLEKLWTVS
jgi:ribosome-associated protein